MSGTSIRCALVAAGVIAMALAAAAPARAQSTGVAACDDFLTKYEACISSKVPAAQQAMFKTQLDQTRKTYSDMAKDALTKPALESACKQSAEQIKASFQAYGCTF